MSPSESELRASLRAGEGDRVDVEAVLAHARTARRDRRRNLAAMGGAVAAVLAVGGVVTAIQLNRHGSTQAGGPPTRTATSASGSPASALPTPALCPAGAPVVPHVNGPASGPLIPDDVTLIRVCVYDVDRLTGTTLLSQQVARQYAQRFNGLPPIKGGLACPQFMTTTTVALLPTTPRGPAAMVVGKIGGCGTTTNGESSRNATGLLGELQRGVPASSTPVPTGSGKNSPGPGPSS